ncbi:alpha/beta hydrolase [Pedobacter cryophilus]|uniref:Alpha/beta hydrolase n=1 Tax=Pedobacter cryophilus TaxID=2571271 RepID=A0A4U1C1A9_9SPHI|nr:alpha/beta hydrolase [Pedobacter cryophilus]TKB98747.1 alpha/beta hydrolase [Pedobacter cryophilus]
MFSNEKFEISGVNELPIIGDITFCDRYPEYVVIFAHGFRGFKDWGTHHLVATYFADKAINFIKFNFSHSGVNPKDLSDITDLTVFSNNTPSKELSDLNQVIGFAKNKFPFLKIALIGHSHGGGISILQAATDLRIDKLITWAAIGAFRDLWKREEEIEWRKTGTLYTLNARTKQQMPLNISLLDDVITHEKEFDLKAAAKNISTPWLIIHGDNDPAVNVEVAKEFHTIQPQKSELLIIEGADHVFGASHPYTNETLPKDLEQVCKACADFILD